MNGNIIFPFALIIGLISAIIPSGGIFGLFVGVSLIVTVLLGWYLAQVFDNKITLLQPIETFLLRMSGAGKTCPTMSWQNYTKAFLVSNLICGAVGFGILSLQHLLPLNPLKLPAMEAWQAFNTVCSFITNTNWQSYSGEIVLSNLSQMCAITFLQVIGATAGLVICVAFLRALSHRPLGNYYQDFTKALLYLMLPYMLIGAVFFISQGIPQTLTQHVTAETIEGKEQTIALGPVASQVSIKQLGTNGGGFYNANASHPLENPNALTNFVQIIMELSIPMALVYMFGLWIKDKKQAWMTWGGMFTLFTALFIFGLMYEGHGNIALSKLSGVHIDQSHSTLLSGGNMEGKEVRFGLTPSMLFTSATTATSTGAVNNMHDSLTPLAGLVPLCDMMLNVLFGGIGVGLMGFLLYGIIAVFITGLMVGRTPEIFGKKIEKAEIILASIAILIHPLIILVPTALSLLGDYGLSSLNNTGAHGLSEILYAYTSAAANNGSAFAGLNANTPWYNISIGIVILLGRYISIIALMAIAGSLAAKATITESAGTLRTNSLLFTTIWVSTILIIGALTFIPVIALGPIAEHLQMVSQQFY